MWLNSCLLKRLVSHLDRSWELLFKIMEDGKEESPGACGASVYSVYLSVLPLLQHSSDIFLSYPSMIMAGQAASSRQCRQHTLGVSTLLSLQAPQSIQDVGTWLPSPRFQRMQVRATRHKTQPQGNSGLGAPALEEGLSRELRTTAVKLWGQDHPEPWGGGVNP